ncbi:MAG: nucleotide sugar dehydrogenase [Balneolaceae bacterium]
MNISVFGLGYVGCVSLGCLSKMGHKVIGVDVSEHKVNLINDGKATIIEEGIDHLIESGVIDNKISATLSVEYAISASQFSFICVGTPVASSGKMNLEYVRAVAEQIGKALKNKNEFHVVAVRSTVPPGTCNMVSSIIEEASGKENGKDFAVISNPEFLREGTAVADYFDPPVTVIGSNSEKGSEFAKNIYLGLKAPVEEVELDVAEIIKFVNNSWHAVKISFANEIGGICKELGVDSHAVMDLFAKDGKLNLGKAYTKPGFAYGGSCLPKDLGGLIYLGNKEFVDIPMISAVPSTNESLKRKAIQKVIARKTKKVAILGLSFKEGTDDLRFSPYVDVAEGLLGKGVKITIYDENIAYTNLMGINKSYIDEHLPHIGELLSIDLESSIKDAEVIILSHKNVDYIDLPGKYPDKYFIELTRNNHTEKFSNLEGINW